MKVLSLFDGISCLRVALGDKVTEYYASEIESNAIKIAQKNYPNTKQIGNVCDISGTAYKGLDLLCGGSPCVDLAICKQNRKGLEGEHSKLFYQYLRILREAQPRWFIFENVASMPSKDKETITKELGVEPIMINASLLSAQCRKRYFWTNIPNVTMPTDKGILIHSILEKGVPAEEQWRGVSIRGRKDASGNWINMREWREDGKASALTSTCSSKLALVG